MKLDEHVKEWKREKNRMRVRRWSAANPEKKSLRDRLYRAANHEKMRIRHRLYQAAHREKVRIRRRLYNAANREKIRIRSRLYDAANREKSRIRHGLYHHRSSKELSDRYIKSLLSERLKIPARSIPQQIIKAHRTAVKALRILTELEKRII